MRYGRLVVAAVLGTAATSAPAVAQEARKLDFGVSGQVEYNTNVARTNKEQAALRGLTLNDTLFTPNATVDLSVPVGRQTVFLNGAAGYTFYRKNTRLNRERADLNGGIRTRLGPCGATLSGGYARGLSQFDDPALVDNVENIQETDSISLDVGCSRPTGFGVTGSASKHWITNDLPALETSNSNRSSMTLGVTYGRPALGVLTIFGSHDQTDYPSRIIEDGYDMNSLGLTFERQLGARIQGTVTAAYTTVDPHASLPGASDLKTTTYSARLSYRASSRLRFQALFDRSITPSSGIGRSYDVAETYRLSGDYDLGSRITLSASAGRVSRDSEGFILLPIAQLTSSDTTTIQGSVRYKQSQRLSFVLNAGREERTTNTPQFDFTNDRVGLSADVTF